MCAPLPRADLIFVLAGLQERKVYALELFERHEASAILFSVGRFEIRKFAPLGVAATLDLRGMAGKLPPNRRHFFVWIRKQEAWAENIATGRFGTWSEIAALARAIEGHSVIHSMIVVSSWYHMLRLRICCRALLPRNLQIRFISLSADREEGKTRQIRSAAEEVLKIPLYCILSVFPGLNS
jgi:hypothetical protein